MANRNGWMVILDPGTWIRALLAAAFMWALAFAVTLARDTTEHDWYATGKLTLTDLLTGLGFDDRAPVEYRTRDGAVVTLTRDGLMYNGDALLARNHLLRTAAKAAGLGAWCGLGGALLGLALCLRPEDERQHGPFRRRPRCSSSRGARHCSSSRLADDKNSCATYRRNLRDTTLAAPFR